MPLLIWRQKIALSQTACRTHVTTPCLGSLLIYTGMVLPGTRTCWLGPTLRPRHSTKSAAPSTRPTRSQCLWPSCRSVSARACFCFVLSLSLNVRKPRQASTVPADVTRGLGPASVTKWAPGPHCVTCVQRPSCKVTAGAGLPWTASNSSIFTRTRSSPPYVLSFWCCGVTMCQGNEDEIVPPKQSELMWQALKDKGLATTLMMYKVGLVAGKEEGR